jgi:hypothetical protein
MFVSEERLLAVDFQAASSRLGPLARGGGLQQRVHRCEPGHGPGHPQHHGRIAAQDAVVDDDLQHPADAAAPQPLPGHRVVSHERDHGLDFSREHRLRFPVSRRRGCRGFW